MPTKQQKTADAEQEVAEKQRLSAAIRDQVLQALGRPADLLRVEVRRLWADHYRVNVLVGPDAGSVKIAHSYFLVADGDGNILDSSPAIARRS